MRSSKEDSITFFLCSLHFLTFSTSINDTSFCKNLHNSSSFPLSQMPIRGGFTSCPFHICAHFWILPSSSLLWASYFRPWILPFLSSLLTECHISVKFHLHSRYLLFVADLLYLCLYPYISTISALAEVTNNLLNAQFNGHFSVLTWPVSGIWYCLKLSSAWHLSFLWLLSYHVFLPFHFSFWFFTASSVDSLFFSLALNFSFSGS